MTMTTPWREDSDALIRQAFTPIVRAAGVTTAAGTFDLELEPGSVITWDEERAPRVTAQLVCRAPAALAQITALDPRAGARVRIDAGYLRAGGVEDVWPLADLGVRSAEWATDRSDVLNLDCAGDESLVIDAAPAVGETVSTTTTAGGAAQLLAATISPAPTLAVYAPGPAVSMTPITDRFSALRDMAERGGLAIYDAGLRSWVCEARPMVAGDPSVTLSVGATGVAERIVDRSSRDDWYNYVLYRHQWRDAGGVEQVVTATAYVSSGLYAITGAAAKRIYQEDRDTPTTQAAANAAASDVLTRLVTRGRGVTVVAPCAWWVRPGHTATVIRPRSATPEAHLIGSVSFDLAEHRMTVGTRVPVSYTAATTTPPSLPATPDPVPPARTTYVTVWTANAGATYRGDGTKRNDTTNLAQGYYDSTNGNQQAVALFTAANSTPEPGYTGETGKTLADALAGATVVKVEEWVYFEHWNYTSGGTARIGRYAGAAVPATYTGAAPTITSPGWPRQAGRWIDVTAATDLAQLAAGNVGLSLGPGIGTDKTYYGRAHGHTDPHPPRRRITYNK